MTHDALGTVRVMRTCGMMGEVVGRAAYLCVRHGLDPRGVYEEQLEALLALLHQPGATRRDGLDGELTRDASIAPVFSYKDKGADRVIGLDEPPRVGIDVASLPGIIVDDAHAELLGPWHTGSLSPFIGSGYRYANAGTQASARFAFDVREEGEYEVRLAWVGHENRGPRVACTIEREGEPALRLRLDQRDDPEGEVPFHELGRFRFPVGRAAVVLSADDATGCVHADAVQVVRSR